MPSPQEVIYRILHNSLRTPHSSGVTVYDGYGGVIPIARLTRIPINATTGGRLKASSGLAGKLKSSEAIEDLVKRSEQLGKKKL